MTDSPPIDKPNRQYVPWYRRCIPGWRTITVVAFLILAMPLGIRWSRLWWLPDVPVPFDVEAFNELPVGEENAFSYFRKAAYQCPRLPDVREFWEKFDPEKGNVTWDQTPEDLKQWVATGQPALDLFRQGGRCSQISFLPPQSYTINTLLPVHQEIRNLIRLTSFDVLRLLDEGNTRETAEVLHDSSRATRHLGRRGCIIERLIGISCHSTLMPAWHQWSRHPHVTAEDIEASLVRMQEDWKLTPPASDQLKVEYLMIINEAKPPMTTLRSAFDSVIEDAAVNRLGLSANGLIARLNTTVPGWQAPVLWTIGEPELSARAARLYLTHELKTCDLPCDEQPPRIQGPFALCRTSDRTGGLTAEEISERIKSTFASQLLGAPGSFQKAIRNEAGRQTLLETEFQLQIRIRRQNITSRSEMEKLLADFPWPIDPCSVERKPIQFRAEDDGLVIWSVGWDGVDQGGVIDTPANNRGQDNVVVIPWPPEVPK